MGDSNNNKKNNSNFDFSKELSTLVDKKTLPEKFAKKLDEKLKEKNVKLSREQFYLLLDKISNILNNYKKTRELNKDDYTISETENTNIQKLIDSIENLEKRINKLEVPGYKQPNISTTDDIKVPSEGNWDWEPLRNIPNDPESVVLLMKWLQYLIDKCGQENLSNILDYYVDVGWISQDVKIDLIDYSQGITQEKKTDKKSNSKITNLPSKDHIQSFIFIQKLRGIQFDKHFVDRIDGEISRITKNLKN